MLDALGVAGYKGGFFIVAGVLAFGAAAVLAGLRGVEQRTTWLVSYLVLALVVAAVLVDRAPLSKGRLEDVADRLDLPFHRAVSERATGNSRCRPCPAFERRYRGPDLGAEAALIEAAAAAARAGYPLELTVEHRRSGRFTTTDGTTSLEMRVRRLDASTELVVRVLDADRPPAR